MHLEVLATAVVCDPLYIVGCILTTLLLLQALDWLANSTQIGDMFRRLCEVDHYRQGYYQDMCAC